MSSQTTWISIFEWITGKRPGLPVELHEEAFEFADGYQRLAGLALHRARQTPGFSHIALAKLEQAVEAIRAGQQENLKIAHEAIQGAAATDTKLLFVKGLMSPAVTRDACLFRWTHDLDALCDDPEAFARGMMERGYYRNGPEDRHELVLNRRAGGMLEIHRYWPVRQTPRGLRSLANVHIPVTDELGYATLALGAVQGRLPGTERLTFPCAEVATLISLTTSMRDVIWKPFSNESARLCHFTDAYALVCSAGFDWGKFDSFVREHRLEDAVAVAEQMFERHFPTNPLRASKVERTKDAALWLQLVNGPSGLWHREDIDSVYFSSISDRLRRLGTTQIAHGDLKRHRSRDDTSFAVVYEAMTGGVLPERRVHAAYGEETITLSIGVDKPAERGDSVFVETGGPYCHWYHEGGSWGDLTRSVEYAPGSYTVDVVLPKTLRGRPVLIGFECLSGADKTTTALPILL